MSAASAAALSIRALDPAEAAELAPAIARLHADAYPVLRSTTDEAFGALVERVRRSADEASASWAIAERGGEIAGVMHLYDFTMNVRGRDAFTGGVGGVAVALHRKRQGIARAMIAWYLDAYRRRGAAFAALYPFRLDFYRALGFGYGGPMYRYRFAPSTLAAHAATGSIRLLNEDDADALIACYERIRSATHGLMTRLREAVLRSLRAREVRIVAVERDGALRGFMQTSVRLPDDDALRNRDELVVRDLLVEDADASNALIGYLRAQSDQFARIVVESADPALFLASVDPRDGSDVALAPPAAHRVAEAGLGVMYRVVDADAALAYVRPAWDEFVVRIDVDDPLLAGAAGTRTIRFGPSGTVRDDAARADAALTIGVADLSSLVMGALRLRDLVRYGLATLEPASLLARVDDAFRTDAPPWCATRF